MTGRRDQDGGAGSSVPEEYADLAERVTRHLSSYSLDPATRARHLHHLRELAAVQPLPRPVHGRVGIRWRGVRRVAGTAAASLAMFTLSGSALAAASQGALPGEPLYGTKRFVEDVQLAAAWTPQGDVAVLLNHAQRRLGETEKLLEQGVTDEQLLANTLTDMQQNLQAAERMAGDDEGLQRQVAMSATDASQRLEPIAKAEDLPEPMRKSADAALATAQEVASTGGSSGTPNGDEQAPAGPTEGQNSTPSGLGPQFPQLPPGWEFPQLPPGMEPSTEPRTETGTETTSPASPATGTETPRETSSGQDQETSGTSTAPGTGTDEGTGEGTGTVPSKGRDTGADYPTPYPAPYPTSYPMPPYPAVPTSYTPPPPERTAPSGAPGLSPDMPAQERNELNTATPESTTEPAPAGGSNEKDN